MRALIDSYYNEIKKVDVAIFIDINDVFTIFKWNGVEVSFKTTSETEAFNKFDEWVAEAR